MEGRRVGGIGAWEKGPVVGHCPTYWVGSKLALLEWVPGLGLVQRLHPNEEEKCLLPYSLLMLLDYE